jgi:molecular chaperone HtpG
MTTQAERESHQFQAEVVQLLDLMINSLYSNKEIFLRELISNGSDAIDRLRFAAFSDPSLAPADGEKLQIRVSFDKSARTITVSDNGIGMSRDEAIDHLGTVAKSGTKAFLEAVKAKEAAAPGLIGQFGVGFYSAFMVADKVVVHTRPAGDPSVGTQWTSDGQGQYAVEDSPKEKRGTDVILHLKEDAKEYLDSWKLRSLVKKFSDFIEHPVVLVTTAEKEGKSETKEETINLRKAIWLRAKNEVSDEEYAEFYKQLSHDGEPPAKVLHFSVEGKTEFRALLFVPAHRPHLFDWEDREGGLKLYVQRVLIMEKCKELLPPYLRFVVGVVDSSDLPLNVSRELLQNNPHLEIIRKNVVRNILGALEAMKNVESEKYEKFFKSLGPILKEGLTRDWENRDKVADLLLYESMNTEPGKFTTLADYASKMPADAKTIVYLAGENAGQLRWLPYLEAFKAAGRDVLLMTDPIDEFVIPQYGEYKEKRFEDAARIEKSAEEISNDVKDQFANLLAAVKVKLADQVSDVRLTKRLTESAACLVADTGAMTAHMERLMRKFGEDVSEQKRVLELNPEHEVVKSLREMHAANPGDPRIDNFSRLLYDQAVIAEGSKIDDPAGFAKRMNDLLLKQ